MACSKELTRFGNPVHSIRAFSCFYDITMSAVNKVKSVDNFWDLYEKFGLNLSENLFWNHYNDCYMVCCRKHID